MLRQAWQRRRPRWRMPKRSEPKTKATRAPRRPAARRRARAARGRRAEVARRHRRGAGIGDAVERLGQGLDDAGAGEHVDRAAGHGDRFRAPQHVGQARRDQHQVAEPHHLHRARRGADVAGMAGADRGRSGCGSARSSARLKSRVVHFAARPCAGARLCRGTLFAESPRPMSQALHPMLNVAIKAARAAGAIINRAALDVDRAAGQHQGAERLRHRGRPRRRGGDHRDAARRLPGPRHPGRRVGHDARRARTATTSGSSIRSTAPPTSSTASRSTASRSRWRFAARSQQAVVYDPTRNDLFYATQGPRRLPQRQAPARLASARAWPTA